MPEYTNKDEVYVVTHSDGDDYQSVEISAPPMTGKALTGLNPHVQTESRSQTDQ